ncbi:MAG: Rieske 2Fe-2S domain-containing protein [Deltaproteobacteria bacterium]|nr:Rieske 2Fe-2S domain-containing protein [Deltaproteobacteria bacterium]
MSSRYPFPPYANGWFRIAYADEIERGQLATFHYLGREFVAFRDASGTARVLDAFCPHLGAHLGHGGTVVEGGRVRCPFHAWEFDGQGTCVRVPYAKKIPPKAQLRAWQTCERNGVVFLHHDAERREPAYEIPEVDEFASDAWTPLEVRRWTVKARWLDMNENCVDGVHFKYVHGAHTIPESEIEVDGPTFRVRNRMKLGTPKGEVDGGIDTTDYGPALQIVRLSGILPTIMLNTATPIDAETTDVSFAYSVSTEGGAEAARGVGAAIIKDLEKQMAQDIPIWENKTYWGRPILAEGDEGFNTYRKWYRQFFSVDYDSRGSA